MGLESENVATGHQPTGDRAEVVRKDPGVGVDVVGRLAGIEEMVRRAGVGARQLATVEVGHKTVVAIHGQNHLVRGGRQVGRDLKFLAQVQ